MKSDNRKNKVAILMSGGVDSSVSALILKNKGFEVEGFFIRFQDCVKSRDAWEDAQKVAKKIGIPLHKIDGRKIFKKNVIDYFISEYDCFKTPNPCVKCNRQVKFGWFLEEAKKRGFSKVATGHYAQIKEDEKGISHLISGKDNNKDQSYFLHYFNQQQLKKIIFPVGNLLKDETRKIAEENGLPVSDKKESQEICFIPDDDYRNFLKKYLKLKTGDIVDTKGKILGKHGGLINYTIGQRKGLGNLSIKDESRKPLFVLGFNKKNNSLIVGLEKDLYQKKAFLKDFHWISEEAKRVAFSGKGLKAKIRYRSEAIPCVVKKSKNELEISFRKTQRAITPGQSAVFYFKREVLGGGIIQ